MSELSKAAKIAFATTFSFYLKAHNFHWNVEGVNFKQFHDLFGDVYEEVYGSIDTFAEQIRALGSYMPGSYTRFSMLSQIEDENDILDDRAMVVELLEDNEKLKKILKMVFDLSEQAGEHGFSDFIAGRMDAHSKHGWMLRSILK
ncbi:MAG: DNA starvation/stationary phase protection protein [Smithella sp.]